MCTIPPIASSAQFQLLPEKTVRDLTNDAAAPLEKQDLPSLEQQNPPVSAYTYANLRSRSLYVDFHHLAHDKSNIINVCHPGEPLFRGPELPANHLGLRSRDT